MLLFSVIMVAVAIGGVGMAADTGADTRTAMRPAMPWTAVIDFDCTSAETRPPKELHALVDDARAERDGMQRRPDRAFALDLNGDRVDEYLVPLACDDLGNCSWAVFAIAPARLVGSVWGAVVYASRSGRAPVMAGGDPDRPAAPERIDAEVPAWPAGPWPPLPTLVRTDDGGAIVMYHRFDRGGYRSRPSQWLTGKEAQRFMEKAGPPTCGREDRS